jgi:hypothetical protein
MAIQNNLLKSEEGLVKAVHDAYSTIAKAGADSECQYALWRIASPDAIE